jgi:hypothetical protein
MATIAYKDLTDDFFVHEIKPDAIVGGQKVFKPTKKKKPTIAIIKEQVCPAHAFALSGKWTHAVNHALQVCKDMKGFQGASNKLVTRQCIAALIQNEARKATSFFDDAVAAVIAGTDAAGHNKLASAASKMLQLFPAFSNDSIIYDSVVRKALMKRNGVSESKAKPIGYYFPEVRKLFSEPMILMPNGHVISVDDYLALPVIQAELAKSGWVASHGLEKFVRSRLLDRVLWLIAAEPRPSKARKPSKKQLLAAQKALAQTAPGNAAAVSQPAPSSQPVANNAGVVAA